MKDATGRAGLRMVSRRRGHRPEAILGRTKMKNALCGRPAVERRATQLGTTRDACHGLGCSKRKIWWWEMQSSSTGGGELPDFPIKKPRSRSVQTISPGAAVKVGGATGPRAMAAGQTAHHPPKTVSGQKEKNGDR